MVLRQRHAAQVLWSRLRSASTDSKRQMVGRNRLAAIGVATDAESLLIYAGDPRRAARAAERARGEAVGTEHAVSRERVDVERFEVVATVSADVAVAEIVNK